ncbi:serine/threonine protein kinase, partial [Mycobacterium senegalense]|nr:serine/threonine protein kinase [Mycolicibacterium senegalense]
AAPAAVPSAAQARAAADLSGRTPVTATRARPTAAAHRPVQPARRTFSSGQRALLWAAGVLGALAIVIAILIVLNAQDRKDQQQSPPPTVTDTVTQTTPYQTPAALPNLAFHVIMPRDAGIDPPAISAAPEQILR